MKMNNKQAVPGPIETRLASALKPHRHNLQMFGNPPFSDTPRWVCRSIEARGQQEPCIILADGTILSGELRWRSQMELNGRDAPLPCRVHPGFATEREETEYVIDANTKRRQLTDKEIARTAKLLRSMYESEGGVKAKVGRPKSGEKRVSGEDTLSAPPLRGKTRDRVAQAMGLGRQRVEAAQTVFLTEGVPPEVGSAVDDGRVASTVAAKVVRQEVKRQGGKLVDGAAVMRGVEEAMAAKKKPKSKTREVETGATLFERYLRLEARERREFDQLHEQSPLPNETVDLILEELTPERMVT